MPSKTTAILDESDEPKPWHRRLRGRLLILLLLLMLIAAWDHGSFDHVLVNVGLNAKDCARNGFGATFCGEELESYREHQNEAKEQLKAAGEKVQHESQETAAKLQREARESQRQLLKQSEEAQREAQAQASEAP